MLVHKQQVAESTKALYKSSNVLASVYNPTDSTLEVIFKKGTRYAYKNVDAAAYMRFETADSQGKVLNSHIKKHEFEKLEDTDPSKIEQMITKYETQNEETVIKEFTTRLQGLLDTDVNRDTVSTIQELTEKTLTILNQ